MTPWATLLNTPQPTAAGTALANSTTLTDINPTPNYTLPANFLQIGSSLTLRAWGKFSTTGTPTLLLGFYYGGVAGTALATSGAVTTGSGVTNVPWRLELDVPVWTTGTSGTCEPQGFYMLGTSVSAYATPGPLPVIAQATVTIDTTAAKILTVGAQWGTANASNTVQCLGIKIFSDGV